MCTSLGNCIWNVNLYSVYSPVTVLWNHTRTDRSVSTWPGPQ
jgi:hypothetical protein